MRNLLIAILFLSILSSCTKSSSYSSYSSTLMPLKAGNTWIYENSVYNSSGTLTENYLDTAYITTQSTTISGFTFYQFKDSLGYFGPKSLLAYDSTVYAIYILDSLNATSAYVLFQITPYDNYLLGTGIDANDTSTCTKTYYAYGFLSTYGVNNYTCYKNIDLTKDCSGNTLSEDIYYVSPGIGIVRIESYLPVSSGSSTLYLSFSQNLKSYKFN